ncbi:MAG: hypothetical protein KIT68_00965 [Phycisphaeraceae bacterium]|nr:hypothetical protein [Phycisphaeraceae bacterium]
MNSLLARFKALPRAAKWLTAFVVFIGAYFLAIEPMLDAIRKYNVEADKIEAELAARRDTRDRVLNSAGEMERAMLAYGKPALPGKGADAAAALERRLNQVLAAHGVRETRKTFKDPVPLTVGREQTPRYNRVAIELNFECDTTKLLAVLKDLERAPEVTAIGRLSVRRVNEPAGRGAKGDSGLLQVQMSPETWTLASAAGERSNP